MSSFETKWSIVLVIAALSACSPTASTRMKSGGGGDRGGGEPAGDDGPPDSDRAWCPNCVAGGQTGDFGGSTSTCVNATQKPLSAELAKKFGVDDWRARVEGSFHTPLRWVVQQNEADLLGRRTWGPYLELPSGYEEQTMVEGKVTLGEPKYFEAADKDQCPDTVAMPAEVELATADGALERIVTRGSFVITSSALSPGPELITRAALADARGSLDLHLDPDATFGAAAEDGPLGVAGDPPTLDVFMNFFPDGVKSIVRPNIGLEIIVEGQWPDDGCGEAALQIDADSKQPWFGGATFAQMYQDWKDSLDDLPPTHGRWLDGSDVDVHAELGDAPAHACLDPHVVFAFDSDSRLVTSDGRVMAKLTHGGMSADTLQLASQDTTVSGAPPQIDPDDFAQRTGIHGVDAAGSPYLAAYFEANYTRDADAIRAEGSLEVDGEPMCQKPGGRCAVDPQVGGAGVDCLQWPPQDTFPELCGRHLR